VGAAVSVGECLKNLGHGRQQTDAQKQGEMCCTLRAHPVCRHGRRKDQERNQGTKECCHAWIVAVRHGTREGQETGQANGSDQRIDRVVRKDTEPRPGDHEDANKTGERGGPAECIAGLIEPEPREQIGQYRRNGDNRQALCKGHGSKAEKNHHGPEHRAGTAQDLQAPRGRTQLIGRDDARNGRKVINAAARAAPDR
jgi:hypothetical protein